MPITLYTDASIKHRRGAWAALIVIDAGPPIEFSGKLRGEFQSSAATEICAIANGLHSARDAGYLPTGSEVEVWCDNEAAVMRVNGQVANRRSTDRRLIDVFQWIRGFKRQHRISVRARHIRGHQRLDSDDPSAIYNLRCDHLCSAVRDAVEPGTWEALVASVAKARARKVKRDC